ncbi:MAG: DUF4276 family protein [Breznakibacter sp.]
MKLIKTAFFVEGYTEQEFLKRLLVEIFGNKEIGIQIEEIKGGSKVGISFTKLETPALTDDVKYYVLIYNCGGDGAIKSYMLDRRSSLINAGFRKIVGLRDVYPDFKRDEIQKLIKGLYFQLPQKDIPISFILSTMEVESWFLAECNHFQNIDKSLTSDRIEQAFGFNPIVYNTELIDEPANTLKAIYKTVGKTYKKEKEIISRTIESLDYGNLYLSVNARIPSFKQLTDEIESIFEN